MPFPATAADIVSAILHVTPEAPSKANPEIPPKLQEIIFRAIEKDRDVRYQSAADLRAELKRLKRDLESSKSHPPPPSSKLLSLLSCRFSTNIAGPIPQLLRLSSGSRLCCGWLGRCRPRMPGT